MTTFLQRVCALALLLAASPAARSQVLGQGKVAEGSGGFTATLTDAGRFGADITWLDDIDGNGFVELLVGADRAHGSEGEAWICFLEAGGVVGSALRIYEGENGFVGPLAWDDLFGTSVARLGDLNGDGSEDIAIGAAGSDAVGLDNGLVWILFLDPDPLFPGRVVGELALGKGLHGSPTWSTPSENFGLGLAPLGDLDGDGVTDLAVGGDPGFSNSSLGGRVWILFLNGDGTVKSFGQIAEGVGGFPVDLGQWDRFGIEIEPLGDLDVNGATDIAVGAYGDEDGYGVGTGAVYVLFLESDGTVKAYQEISQTTGSFVGPLEFNAQFGNGIAWLPATRQLLVGAYGSAPHGASWLLDLLPDGTVSHDVRLTDGESGFCGGLDPGDWFGHGASWVGDVDGDGSDDVAIGAMGDDDGGPDRGAVWITLLAGNKAIFGYCACDAALAPCANADPGAGCANSTGQGATLAFAGGASVSADDLVLTAANVPPQVMGIFFMGGGQACPQPFGDGLLCVSPGPTAFCRYPIQNSGPAGMLQLGPGVAALSQTFAPNCSIDAGESWRFQAWFRDPSGPCGAAFNLSSAVSVTFEP